jgi:glucose/mannose transport system permease protein
MPVAGRRGHRGIGFWLVMITLVAAALFFLMPVYIMVVNGMKDKSYMTISDMWKLPRDLRLSGFRIAWNALSPNLGNSFKMAIPATVISCFIGALNGYLLSKWKFRGSDVLFTLILFGMFIPYQSILVPLILTLQRIHVPGGSVLYGNWYGLTVVHIIYGIPVTALIFRNYFTNVPNELVEAARIDGAGLFGIFFRIMLPLSAPAFVVVGIFQFTNIWNDFLFAVTIVPNPADQPVTVALNNLQGTTSVDWTGVMGGAFIAALPTLFIYVLLGRFFIRGLLSGSMKG